jgi:hypothetical protein
VTPPLSDDEEENMLLHNKRLKFLAKARMTKLKKKKKKSRASEKVS